MQVKGFKVIIIIVALVVTLALLFGASFAHDKFNIEKPLFELYSETKLVSNPEIIEQDDVTTIKVMIGKTENLYKVYQELSDGTKEVLGNTEFAIEVKDKRSKELEEGYSKTQFIIYEALAKGNYTSIPNEVSRIANGIGADAKVNIDQENIYIALYKGDSYLYEIIPRENQIPGSVADRMGSDNQ